jgi:hypothetical protein
VLPLAARIIDQCVCAWGESSSSGCAFHPGEKPMRNRFPADRVHSHQAFRPVERSAAAVMKLRANSTMARRLIVMSGSPPSPISSTDPWPTFRLDGSQPIPPGRSARPSRITCYARPRAERPCTVTWSTSPPAWPDPNANRSCTYPPTGPGNPPGSPCGTTPSADDPASKPQPGPRQEKRGRPAARSPHRQPQSRSNTQPTNTGSIGGIRLSVRRPAMQFRRRPTRRGSRR